MNISIKHHATSAAPQIARVRDDGAGERAAVPIVSAAKKIATENDATELHGVNATLCATSDAIPNAYASARAGVVSFFKMRSVATAIGISISTRKPFGESARYKPSAIGAITIRAHHATVNAVHAAAIKQKAAVCRRMARRTYVVAATCMGARNPMSNNAAGRSATICAALLINSRR